MAPNSEAWTRPKPGVEVLRTDAALAILLALAATTTALLYQRSGIYVQTAPVWVWVIGLGLCTLPLAARRHFPVPVAIAVSIGFFVCGQFGVPEILIVNVCLFLALYSVGAWEQNRALAVWSRIIIAVAMIAWLLLGLLFAADSASFPGLPRSGIFSAFATFAVLQIITNLMYFGAAYFFGERGWRTARTQTQLEAQGHELELERQTGAAQAVALDRLSIARELHDVVAHHVSVMGIQAAAARRVLTHDAGAAAASLELIEQSARTAVDELRQLVHTLRTPEAEGISSTVGISQLPTLVAECQSAGTPASFIVAGEPRPLPMLVDVALYRVVQEALTNVRKHAGRRASAEVRLRFSDTAVEVEVSDDGTRQTLARTADRASVEGIEGIAGGANSGGLGIRGMRERIGAVGGSVSAGRREHGGFIVRATVPNPIGAAAGPAMDAAPDAITSARAAGVAPHAAAPSGAEVTA